MSTNSNLYKKLLGVGLASSLALVGAFMTAPAEAPNGQPVLKTYLDTGGVPTICLGSTGPDVKVGKSLTYDQCIQKYADDLIKHDKQLRSVTKVPFKSDWEYGAMLDFTFNKGIGNLQSSTMLKYFNAGRHDLVCDELNKWVYGKNMQGQKVVIKGLVNRASAEYRWCMGDVPQEVKDLANEANKTKSGK